eukprot:scaffold24964_cov101-Isochrysis_galbana.AAC.1
MTDSPIDDTVAREQDTPGTTDAKHRAPVHGHTGGVPSDKALSDTRSMAPAAATWSLILTPTGLSRTRPRAIAFVCQLRARVEGSVTMAPLQLRLEPTEV